MGALPLDSVGVYSLEVLWLIVSLSGLPLPLPLGYPHKGRAGKDSNLHWGGVTLTTNLSLILPTSHKEVKDKSIPIAGFSSVLSS